MINIQNINLFYQNRCILQHSSFAAKKGNITLITGKSGSGKTSLINLISLNQFTEKLQYTIEGIEVTKDNKTLIQQIQNQYFSYVIQDYELFSNLTILENIKLIQSFSNEGLDYKEVLKLVQLDSIPLNQKVYELSGGEKQRLALALAILRNTDYILLDEPTASLDENNAKIIVEVLDSLKEQGKGIIIVSHDPDLFHADIIYKIENHELICNQKIEEEHCQEVIRKSINHNINKLYYNSRKIFHSLFICMIGISIGLTGVVFTKGKAKIHNIEQMINSSDKEKVLVYNHEGLEANVSFSSLLQNYSIDLATTEFKEINSFYPYYVFNSREKQATLPERVDSYFLEIKKDGQILEPKSSIVYDEYQSIIYKQDIGGNIISIDEDKLQNIEIVNNQIKEGCYISNTLYNIFKFDSIDNITVHLNVHIPVLYLEVDWTDSNDNFVVRSRYPYTAVIEFELPVKGVLYNDYSHDQEFGGYTNNLYMDYRWMENQIKTYRAKYLEEARNNENNRKFISSDQNDVLGYIVNLNNSDKINDYIEFIQDINPNYCIGSNYADGVQQLKVLYEQNTRQNILSFILIGIIIMISIIIQKLDFNKQKMNYSYLKINGIDVDQLYRDIIFKQVQSIAILASIIVGGMLVIQAFAYGSMTVFFAIISVKSIISIVIVFVVLFISNYFINKKEIQKLSIQLLSKKS